MNNIDPVGVAVSFGVLLLSLTIHEAAHAWTADKLGDPTARALGRVSLNPLVHIDWVGTVLLPIIAAVSHLPLIGWAKPVPVDVRRLRHQRRDYVLVAAAGPASNLILAVAAAITVRAYFLSSPGTMIHGACGVAVRRIVSSYAPMYWRHRARSAKSPISNFQFFSGRSSRASRRRRCSALEMLRKNLRMRKPFRDR